MPCQAILEYGDRLTAAAGGMERDRINITIARAIRLELGCAAQLGECFVRPFEAGQCQAEGMMQPRVPSGIGSLVLFPTSALQTRPGNSRLW